jgi:uncharacterized protein YqjF (DUF2071 family)
MTSRPTPDVSGFSDRARDRLLRAEGRPLFLCDWDRVVFLHYEADGGPLQRQVPFDLDLRDGKAYVSLVAFTLRNLRPSRGGWLAACLSAPVARHAFLNVRTYVRVGGEPGIYFLAEWLSSPLAVLLGPPLFGLPYRLGRLDYDHRPEGGGVRGRVRAGGQLCYHGRVDPQAPLGPCEAGGLEEFLLERYTAFTRRGRRRRFFRVWHPPWLRVPVAVQVDEGQLLASTGAWSRQARLVGAAYSPGVRDVWIGRPLDL